MWNTETNVGAVTRSKQTWTSTERATCRALATRRQRAVDDCPWISTWHLHPACQIEGGCLGACEVGERRWNVDDSKRWTYCAERDGHQGLKDTMITSIPSIPLIQYQHIMACRRRRSRMFPCRDLNFKHPLSCLSMTARLGRICSAGTPQLSGLVESSLCGVAVVWCVQQLPVDF